MKIKGKLHRVTNLKTFVASYLSTNGNPTQGFTNWGSARVHLAIDMGGGFPGGFLPAMSLKTDANSQGEFSFTSNNDFPAQFRGRIIAYNATTIPSPLPGMPPIPVFDPVYRSAEFKFSDVSTAEQNAVQKIFIYQETTPSNLGISQQDVNAQLSDLKKDLKLDSLKASILSNRVSVNAEKSGGEVKFSAYVSGSTSEDLNRVIEVKAGDIDIDLPGPDFIVGLCVSKDDIESQIRKGLTGLSAKISQTLLAEFNKQAPGASALATVSVWRVRYVQTGTKTINMPGIPPIVVPIYSVVPDAAFGVPKKLY